jgi:ribosome-binding factor A
LRIADFGLNSEQSAIRNPKSAIEMSNRTVRVNELLQRELSDILRKRYQTESVAITVTEVRVSPDLRDARVFISVVGDEAVTEEKIRWLRSKAADIREEVARRIVLKFLPKFQYVLDKSTARGARLLQMLDEIAPAQPAKAEDEE